MKETLKDKLIFFLTQVNENSPNDWLRKDINRAIRILERKAIIENTLESKEKVYKFITDDVFTAHPELINPLNFMALEKFIEQVETLKNQSASPKKQKNF